MALVKLTRRETFSASHRLHNPKLSDQRNKEIFGKCNNPNGHGHNYVLEVSVKGQVDEVTGMVINLVQLKEVIRKAVMDDLDHKNVDLDVEYFRVSKKPSTTENLAVYIWGRLKAELKRLNLKGEILDGVKIWETEKNIVEYRGE